MTKTLKQEKRLEWLKRYSETCGVSGFEKRMKELLSERLSGVSAVSYDNLGSVVFTAKGGTEAPKIMLASHMDEIGFLVKYITKEGFLKFVCLGGWWEQVMLAQRVTVHGTSGDVVGVIGSKPPHILTVEERNKVVQKKDMYIDVGAKDEAEARAMGLAEGCAVTPYAEFAVMGSDGRTLLGKAWDNRIGCAIMADVIDEMSVSAHPNKVYGVATVQEEVGLRGAQTSVNLLKPDIGFVIDTCVAGGTPGVNDEIAPAKIGDGIAITIYDAGLIPNTALRDYVFATAKREGIPVQVSVSEGGSTDGGRIHLHDAGVLTVVFSVPTRYIHSHQSIIHLDDYEGAVRLIVALLKELDEKKYQELLLS